MSEPIHARLPPSGSHRWTTCTASVRFIEANAAVLPKESSVYADEGTRAHALLTARLRHTLGQVADNAEMDRIITEMERYIANLRVLYEGMGAKVTLLVDQRVPLFYLPKQKGTLDVALVVEFKDGTKLIIVIDLKYGVGVGVYAERNKQLAIYAESQIRGLEQIEDFAPETPVTLVIYQPRDRNDYTIVREWQTTRGELSLFCETEIGVAAQQILAGDPGVFSPGDACKFCPATGICAAYANRGLSAISDEPVDVVLAQPKIELPLAESLTREQRQRVITSRKVMEQWLEAVEDQEMTELLAGAQPLQFKLVEGKSNRQWADEEAAKQLLRNHLTAEQTNPPSNLISPAAAEKLLKGIELSTKFENKFAALITKPPGKPSLVPVTDKRPALMLNPSEGLTPMREAEDVI